MQAVHVIKGEVIPTSGTLVTHSAVAYLCNSSSFTDSNKPLRKIKHG